MTAKIHVRHVQTGEIKQVTEEQRASQNKNFWVRVTGDVTVTKPADVPVGTDASPDAKPASKTTTSTK
ncbi:hypothetical protein DEI99_005295 [Curtobacterium sp. MCLR17_036]|uniref:hypothetical protein n=1 Tax=Curtobacterium sp. MCLR17_036 TaxID=2175620 RepID=UPI000DA9B62C|nr:hypothetical protein [Curtobacterium sp. MCLR17_036]WIE65955.1 hypothetical protein DEI99_005295 [Curtobacterium sp. MCLR17_036]